MNSNIFHNFLYISSIYFSIFITYLRYIISLIRFINLNLINHANDYYRTYNTCLVGRSSEATEQDKIWSEIFLFELPLAATCLNRSTPLVHHPLFYCFRRFFNIALVNSICKLFRSQGFVTWCLLIIIYLQLFYYKNTIMNK